MDPEAKFDFSESNIKKTKEFVLSTKDTATDLALSGNIKLFNLFADIIIEAMQFADIIPHSKEEELASITNEISFCKRLSQFLRKLIRTLIK